ncbi:MAG: PAS domain S-box protein [Candidatus Protistobacter heckmanni]|nr:PAS domain S-box protein [Candidatus Protistobacter heckmanni]
MADMIIPARYREAHRHGLRRLSQGASPRLIGKRIELFALRADGSEFPIALFISLIQHGGARYYTTLIADLSEQKRSADELARQCEAMRQSEKLSTMGALLANVAHELNNPLAILMGRAALLEDRLAEPGGRLQDPRRRRTLRQDRAHLPRHGAQAPHRKEEHRHQ